MPHPTSVLAHEDLVSHAITELAHRGLLDQPLALQGKAAEHMMIDHLRSQGAYNRAGVPRAEPSDRVDEAPFVDVVEASELLPLEVLTERERQAVLGLAAGHSQARIAGELGVSESRIGQLVQQARGRLTGRLPTRAVNTTDPPTLIDHAPVEALPSPRELQVLAVASNGATLGESARRLHISPETVREHRRNARRKLSAKNMTHAVAEAIRRGLIE